MAPKRAEAPTRDDLRDGLRNGFRDGLPDGRAGSGPLIAGARSLERAFTLLEAIKEARGATARDLAGRVGLHRSSIYRLLAVLQKWGYVRLDPQTMKFTLGWHFLEMADQINVHQELPRAAAPHLEELMATTRETVHLMALEGVEVVYLAKVESPETIRMHSRVGARRPAYCTAGGKVLLANLPPAERERRVRSCRLEACTPNTITDPERLLEELERTVQRGYALDDEEVELGVRCVASPVLLPSGTALAAVTVSAPAFRAPIERLLTFVPLLQRTVADIGRSLGLNG